MSSLNEVMGAIASQLQAELAPVLDGVQVDPKLVFNPTPPAIDVFPSDPFMVATAFGHGSREAVFTIRARVTTADHEGGQELLLDLLDPTGPFSVIRALATDRTLRGTVDDSDLFENSPSGFIAYADVNGAGNLLGCEWRLRCVLNDRETLEPPAPDEPPVNTTPPAFLDASIAWGETLDWDVGGWAGTVEFYASEVQIEDLPNGSELWDYLTFPVGSATSLEFVDSPPDVTSGMVVGHRVRVMVTAGSSAGDSTAFTGTLVMAP